MAKDTKTTREKRPTRRRWLRRLGWATGIGVLLLVAIHQYVVWGAAAHIYSLADVPKRDVILVLGASVLPDGRPSPMLAERLRAAAELYRAGKAPKILVSGDHGHEAYNEVRAMARVLEAAGVPRADISLDHAGFRTFDTMYRARLVFGIDSAIVVSNPFHVARAVFLGRSAGIDVVGVGADYGVGYSDQTRRHNLAREVLARILAFADVFLLGTEPRVLGPGIDAAGDSGVTRDR